MTQYLLALDQGTTSSRAILFDQDQNIAGLAQKEFTQHYPREGWVEHDAMEIWSSQYAVMMEVIAQTGIEPAQIAAIGITNQRETNVIWDRKTGRPIHNAIVWQCRRTAPLVDELLARGLGDHIRRTTGLVPDAYFSATKIKWILDTVDGAREMCIRDRLGGNGAGKTTSLKLMAGLLRPYRGEIRLGGTVGVLPQNPQALFVKKTVREDLLELLRDRELSAGQREARAARAVSLCRLEELLDRHPYDLSGGEQQRAKSVGLRRNG